MNAPFHIRDRLMVQANPVLQVPVHCELPELGVGHHRFLLAKDGLYLETRSRAVRVVLQLGPSAHELPFGELSPHLTVAGGRQVPKQLIEEAVRLARAAMPNEWAAMVVLEDGGFRLKVPEVIRSSAGGISYSTAGIDPLNVVLDVHSHHRMGAFFSAQDDSDDSVFPTPVFVASVLGKLHQDQPEMVSRVVVHRRFYDMHLRPLGLSALTEPAFPDEEEF
ncbi:MAG TPA: PRTRC system protein A [Nevskia sp.]|nr:PRTRC system protein A [Nevskia sp.]